MKSSERAAERKNWNGVIIRLFYILIAVCMLCIPAGWTGTVFAAENQELSGYVKIGKNHYYYDEDGNRVRNTWVTIDGVKHWFKGSGKEIRPNKYIAFTFDDGPTANTAKILKILKEYGATATFFQVGYMVSGQKQVEKKIWKQGSEIGIHTWDHADLTKLPAGGIRSQADRCAAVIRQYSGKAPKLMRPPYGACNGTVKAAAPCPLILWSITDEGLYARSWEMTANAILRNPKNGDIALMHDLQAYSVQVCSYTIPRLIRQGFRIVSVSDLAKKRGRTLKKGSVYGSIK